jgi:hypothetical protein
MRIRTRLGVLTCCCAVLAGCTAAAPRGPNTNVTTPRVGKPLVPASAQAALSSEAFTPYAALGISNDDGLAPGESEYALVGPCMSDAGYRGVTFSNGVVLLPLALRGGSGGPGGLAITLPWGAWGYLGTADAQQYGFQVTPNAAFGALDIGTLPTGPPSGSTARSVPVGPPNVPGAEQAAASKCGTIIADFATATQDGALAGITALANVITTDVAQDQAVQAASRAWSACMTTNGYSVGQPQAIFLQEVQAMYGKGNYVGGSVSAAANEAQIAAAVTDADCSQATDLAGIYFAVQASYEQQLVTANQQALDTAVSEYRSAYARELSKLPALLGTTRAQLFHPAKPAASHASHTG